MHIQPILWSSQSMLRADLNNKFLKGVFSKSSGNHIVALIFCFWSKGSQILNVLKIKKWKISVLYQNASTCRILDTSPQGLISSIDKALLYSNLYSYNSVKELFEFNRITVPRRNAGSNLNCHLWTWNFCSLWRSFSIKL